MAAGLPIVGSMFALAREAQYFFYDQYLKLGPVFRVSALGRKFNVLAGPEANIFVAAEPDALTAWDTWEPFVNDFGARKVLTMLDGSDHSRMRRLMRQSFSRDAIEKQMAPSTKAIVDVLRGQPLNVNLPVVPMLQRTTADVLGLLSNNQLPGGYFDDIVLWWSTLVEVYLGHISPVSRLKRKDYQHAKARVREFVEGVVTQRQAQRAVDAEEDNFIDNLLATSAKDPEFLSHDEVLFHALAAYFAGLDTVANITAFMLFELLQHPTILAQARAEADVAFKDGPPSPASFRNMPVLHGVALETLRLYPVAGILMRNAARDFTFAGFDFKKDDPVVVASAAPHFAPAIYANPWSFDITRYIAPRNEHRPRGVFAPFGAGVHTCLGAGLAEVQIMLGIATLLHHADFEMSPANYKLKKAYLPSLTPKGLGIRITGWRSGMPL